MTMIASIANFGQHLIINDILISSDTKPKEFILPSVGQDILKHLPQNRTSYPYKLKQKTYILKKNLCVSFTGPVIEFNKILYDLKRFCSYYDRIDENRIKEFASQLHLDKLTELSVLIVLVEEGKVVQFTYGHWLKSDTKTFGKIAASGSGDENFIGEVRKIILNKLETAPENSIVLSPILGILCKLLINEVAALDTLTHHYGGGFEIVYYDGESFKKLEEFAFATVCTMPGNPEVVLPWSVGYYNYEHEMLTLNYFMIQHASREEQEDNIVFISTTCPINRFVVNPTDVDDKDVDRNKFSRLNSFQCNMVATGLIYGIRSDIVYIAGIVGQEPNVKVVYKEAKVIELHFKKTFLQSLMKDAKAGAANVNADRNIQ